MENNKFYFNGLNELRAIAAIMVIFHHIELFKHRDGIGSLFDCDFVNYFIDTIGKKGVFLFFVLSGFLITYLLLQEKEKHGTILFKKFYMRRIFRIWPLYYLVFLISFFLLPVLASNFSIFENVTYYFSIIIDESKYSLESFFLYVSFLPNIAVVTGKIIAGASQSWSVGVEEQFYIIWPIIIAFFRKEYSLIVFLFLFVLFTFFAIFDLGIISLLIKIIPFQYMCIGAIGGYLFYKKRREVSIATNSKILYLLNVLLILILITVPLFSATINNNVQYIVIGLLFLCLILFTVNDSNRLVLRNKLLFFLGKISYGLYMYHPIVMFLVFPFANKYIRASENLIIYNIFVYLFIFGITYIASHFSFKYIESYFINIKDNKYKSL